jgi:hypothetical protein
VSLLQTNLAKQTTLAQSQAIEIERINEELARAIEGQVVIGKLNESLNEQLVQLDRAHKQTIESLKREKSERAKAAADFEAVLEVKTQEHREELARARQAMTKDHEAAMSLQLAQTAQHQATIKQMQERLEQRNREIERLNAALAD